MMKFRGKDLESYSKWDLLQIIILETREYQEVSEPTINADPRTRYTEEELLGMGFVRM